MNIPTPSFLNIRVVALIIISFVLCFLVGAVKDVFGQDYPGECVVNLIDKRSTTSDTTYTSIPNFYFDVDENGAMIVTSSNSGTGLKDVVRFSQGFLLQTFWWDKDALIFKPSYVANMPIGMLVPSANVASWPNYPSELPERCGSPCEEEKAQWETSCEAGVDWSDWSNETCSGARCNCVPPEVLNPVTNGCQICPSGEFEAFSGTCIPLCPYGTGEPVGSFLSGANYNTCIVPPCGLGEYKDENNICRPNCPSPKIVDPATGECKNDCADGYSDIDGDCKKDCPPGTTRDPLDPDACRSGAEPEVVPPSTKPDPTTPPAEKTPEPDSTPNPDDPSDEKLGAIKKELGKLVEQGNDRGKQLAGIGDSLDWIGDNTSKVVKNLEGIGNALGDMEDQIAAGVANGIGDGLDGVEDAIGDLNGDIDQLTDAVDDISDGTYTAPGDEETYVSEEHDFGTRTSDFLSQMKTTGFFSLPDKLSSSIPGGGSSTYIISTGATFGGDHTIDFNYLSGGLTILKYIFQIAGMALAIRIVTLKS